MTYGIYKITKKDTRQIYIGQSIDIERRIEEHKASRYDNTYIDNAINKHGLMLLIMRLLKNWNQFKRF